MNLSNNEKAIIENLRKFYITNNEEQANKWAKRKAGLRGKKPALVMVLFDEEEASPYIERFSDDIR